MVQSISYCEISLFWPMSKMLQVDFPALLNKMPMRGHPQLVSHRWNNRLIWDNSWTSDTVIHRSCTWLILTWVLRARILDSPGDSPSWLLLCLDHLVGTTCTCWLINWQLTFQAENVAIQATHWVGAAVGEEIDQTEHRYFWIACGNCSHNCRNGHGVFCT